MLAFIPILREEQAGTDPLVVVTRPLVVPFVLQSLFYHGILNSGDRAPLLCVQGSKDLGLTLWLVGLLFGALSVVGFKLVAI